MALFLREGGLTEISTQEDRPSYGTDNRDRRSESRPGRGAIGTYNEAPAPGTGAPDVHFSGKANAEVTVRTL